MRRRLKHRAKANLRRKLRLESLEDRRLLAPLGASDLDTSEYMLGDVLVTVVLFESDGTTDESTEDWTQEYIDSVKSRVQTGLQWWEDALRNLPSWWYEGNPNPPEIRHTLNFQFDFTHADTPFETKYELITRRSQDHVFPVRDFLRSAGTWNDSDGFEENARRFNHSQREAAGADWAYTIFIANDENDMDGKFAVDGHFLQAFAYPGGQYIVSPAGRPASTFAHENGHQFWARDEYTGAGSYTDHRGYYDATNSNAADNPNGQEREPSIMARGELLNTAYAEHTSSRSSLEMVGWRDRDADGIFDVLDVPISLEGFGRYDDPSKQYRFIGSATVQTLPNLNPAGTRNDMTTNKIARIEYRVDNENWTTALTINASTAELDLSFPLTGNEQSLEIRAVATEIDEFGNEWTIAESEPSLLGDLDRTSTVGMPGVNGFVWHDVDSSNDWNRGELGLSGWTVSLVDDLGATLDLTTVVEPDDLPTFQDINDLVEGVTFSSIGSGVQSAAVRVAEFGTASTGTHTFIHQRLGSIWSADWSNNSRRLRIDFDNPVAQVALDAVAGSDIGIGRLDAFNTNNEIIARYTTREMAAGTWETMTIGRGAADIAYVIAGSHSDTFVRLDQLTIGPKSTTTTDLSGAYHLPYLLAGDYIVALTRINGWDFTSPADGKQAVTVQASDVITHTDFGVASSANGKPWQNPQNAFDVSADSYVTPRDVLLIIGFLDKNGSMELPNPTSEFGPPPFVDVNGDNLASPIDALLVLTYLNAGGNPGNNGDGGNSGGGGGSPEGESVTRNSLTDGSTPTWTINAIPAWRYGSSSTEFLRERQRADDRDSLVIRSIDIDALQLDAPLDSQLDPLPYSVAKYWSESRTTANNEPRRHHQSIYDLAANGRIKKLRQSPDHQTDSENHESLVKTTRARDFGASFARHELGPTEWDSVIDLLARDERHKDGDEDLTIDADSEPTIETDSSDF